MYKSNISIFLIIFFDFLHRFKIYKIRITLKIIFLNLINKLKHIKMIYKYIIETINVCVYITQVCISLYKH